MARHSHDANDPTRNNINGAGAGGAEEEKKMGNTFGAMGLDNVIIDKQPNTNALHYPFSDDEEMALQPNSANQQTRRLNVQNYPNQINEGQSGPISIKACRRAGDNNKFSTVENNNKSGYILRSIDVE